jgi:hypothetical protein
LNRPFGGNELLNHNSITRTDIYPTLQGQRR